FSSVLFRSHDVHENKVGIEKTLSLIKKMQGIVTQTGGKFVVVIMPIFFELEGKYPFESVHNFLVKKLVEMKVDVLDLYPAFKGYDTKSLWVHPIEQHPNERAHLIIAEELEKWLSENLEI